MDSQGHAAREDYRRWGNPCGLESRRPHRKAGRTGCPGGGRERAKLSSAAHKRRNPWILSSDGRRLIVGCAKAIPRRDLELEVIALSCGFGG
jgi:hypothetical protein